MLHISFLRHTRVFVGTLGLVVGAATLLIGPHESQAQAVTWFIPPELLSVIQNDGMTVESFLRNEQMGAGLNPNDFIYYEKTNGEWVVEDFGSAAASAGYDSNLNLSSTSGNGTAMYASTSPDGTQTYWEIDQNGNSVTAKTQVDGSTSIIFEDRYRNVTSEYFLPGGDLEANTSPNGNCPVGFYQVTEDACCPEGTVFDASEMMCHLG